MKEKRRKKKASQCFLLSRPNNNKKSFIVSFVNPSNCAGSPKGRVSSSKLNWYIQYFTESKLESGSCQVDMSSSRFLC